MNSDKIQHQNVSIKLSAVVALDAKLHEMIESDLKCIKSLLSILPISDRLAFEIIQREILIHVLCSASHAFTLNPSLKEE